MELILGLLAHLSQTSNQYIEKQVQKKVYHCLKVHEIENMNCTSEL